MSYTGGHSRGESASGSHAESLISNRNFANIASNALELDRQKAKVALADCKAGNYSNFGTLLNWSDITKETKQYFHISDREWKDWNKGYKAGLKNQKEDLASSVVA